MKNSKILKRFAQRVRALRVENGWTQEELARRADLHRTYIGSIERYERNVSLLNVERIAAALKVDVKDLL
ncbi:MAG: helix-turn-helix domain-containing protein [Sedimentisphaerales bacterium]